MKLTIADALAVNLAHRAMLNNCVFDFDKYNVVFREVLILCGIPACFQTLECKRQRHYIKLILWF